MTTASLTDYVEQKKAQRAGQMCQGTLQMRNRQLYDLKVYNLLLSSKIIACSEVHYTRAVLVTGFTEQMRLWEAKPNSTNVHLFKYLCDAATVHQLKENTVFLRSI